MLSRKELYFNLKDYNLHQVMFSHMSDYNNMIIGTKVVSNEVYIMELPNPNHEDVGMLDVQTYNNLVTTNMYKKFYTIEAQIVLCIMVESRINNEINRKHSQLFNYCELNQLMSDALITMLNMRPT